MGTLRALSAMIAHFRAERDRHHRAAALAEDRPMPGGAASPLAGATPSMARGSAPESAEREP